RRRAPPLSRLRRADAPRRRWVRARAHELRHSASRAGAGRRVHGGGQERRRRATAYHGTESGDLRRESGNIGELEMNPIHTLVKSTFSSFGLKISRRDRLEEQIPVDYLQSPFLPRVYRQSAGRLFYFRHMFDLVGDVPGDIVECGVSTG